MKLQSIRIWDGKCFFFLGGLTLCVTGDSPTIGYVVPVSWMLPNSERVISEIFLSDNGGYHWIPQE